MLKANTAHNSQYVVPCISFYVIHISYTMPTRAVWNLLPKPEGQGNEFHVSQGGFRGVARILEKRGQNCA